MLLLTRATLPRTPLATLLCPSAATCVTVAILVATLAVSSVAPCLVILATLATCTRRRLPRARIATAETRATHLRRRAHQSQHATRAMQTRATMSEQRLLGHNGTQPRRMQAQDMEAQRDTAEAAAAPMEPRPPQRRATERRRHMQTTRRRVHTRRLHEEVDTKQTTTHDADGQTGSHTGTGAGCTQRFCPSLSDRDYRIASSATSGADSMLLYLSSRNEQQSACNLVRRSRLGEPRREQATGANSKTGADRSSARDRGRMLCVLNNVLILVKS